MNEKVKLEERWKAKSANRDIKGTKRRCRVSSRYRTANKRMTSSGLKWYSELREELRKYGISVEDISKLAKLVNNLKQYDYNVEKVINLFSDLEGLRLHHKYLQETIPSFEDTIEDLKRECSTLEASITMHNQVLSKYHDLEIMGFGLKSIAVSLDYR